MLVVSADGSPLVTPIVAVSVVQIVGNLGSVTVRRSCAGAAAGVIIAVATTTETHLAQDFPQLWPMPTCLTPIPLL